MEFHQNRDKLNWFNGIKYAFTLHGCIARAKKNKETTKNTYRVICLHTPRRREI